MRQLKPQVVEITLHRPLDEVFAPFTGDPYPFWLDSSRPGGEMGRWSFMGSDPFLVLKTFGRRIIMEENGRMREFVANPFEVLRQQLNRFHFCL